MPNTSEKAILNISLNVYKSTFFLDSKQYNNDHIIHSS